MNVAKNFIQTIRVAEHELKLAALLESKKSFFAYFHGSFNEQTNQSWCSDCDISRPLIEKQHNKLECKKNFVFAKFPIETCAEWKNPQFAYRVNKFKVNRIPTLIFFLKGVEMGRLVESELFDESNLGEFFDDCLAQDE